MAAEAHVGNHSSVANINVHDIGGGHDHGKAHGGKDGKKSASAKPALREFKAEEFKHQVDIRPESKKLFGRGVERTVKISHETEQLYKDSLILHIKDLSRVDNSLLEDLGFTTDLDLKRQFLDARGNVNDIAVAGLFNDAKGFALATMVIEQQLAIGSLIVGWGTDRTVGKRNPHQEKWAFDLLSKDPKLAEYVRKTTNIDVNDFEWSRLKDGVKRKSVDPKDPSSHRRTSPDTTNLKRRLKSMEDARYKFLHDDLKVPKKLAKRPAEYSLRTLKMNQMNLIWESEVTDELGNIGIEWKKRGLISGTQLDHPENWRNLLQARESVMTKILQDTLESTSTKVNAQDTRYGRLKSLEDVVSSRSVKDRTQRQQKAQERIDRTEKDRDSADTAKASLDDVISKRREVSFMKGKAAAEVAGVTAGNEVADLQSQIDVERKKIDDISVPTSFEKRRQDAKGRRDAAINAVSGHGSLSSTKTDEAYNIQYERLINQAESKYNTEITQIAKEQKVVEEEIIRLEGYKRAIENAEAALTGNDFLQSTNETSRNLEKSFAALRVISVTDSSGVTHDIKDVELETLSVDEILKKVNEIREISVGMGNPAYTSWPEGENDAHREQVILAIAEARASVAPPTGAGSSPGEHTIYKNWGLTDAEIVTFTRDQVNKYMNDLNLRSGGTEGWPSGDNTAREPEVDAVLAFGKNKLSKRIEKLSEVSKAASGELPKLQYEYDNISTSEGEQKRLDMAMRLVERKSEIYPRALNVRQEIDKLTDSSDASTTTDPNATGSEKAASVKMWELQWTDLLSGYQGKTTEREALFTDARKFYDPEAVVRSVAGRLDIDVTKPISIILLELKERVTGMEPGTNKRSRKIRIPGRDFRRALQGYINEYADDTERALS